MQRGGFQFQRMMNCFAILTEAVENPRGLCFCDLYSFERLDLVIKYIQTSSSICIKSYLSLLKKILMNHLTFLV